MTYLLRHAWRSISRMRTYTIINLVGLVISLTGTIVIARYVHQELTVDDYIEDVDRVYVLCQERGGMYGDVDCDYYAQWMNGSFAPLEDKAVESYTSYYKIPRHLSVRVDDNFMSSEVYVSDSTFLKIFSYRVIEGRGVYDKPNSVLVSRRFAERVWHGESAVGKTIYVFGQIPIEVCGVLDEPSTKASFRFDMLVNPQFAPELRYYTCTIIRLRKGEDYKAFNRRCNEIVSSFHNVDMDIINREGTFLLVPIKQLYFMDNYQRRIDNERTQGYWDKLMLVTASGVLLLFVGLFNFFNILTVVNNNRVKDFAIKKTFGASYGVMFRQLMTENGLITSFAMVLSWLLAIVVTLYITKHYDATFYPSVVFDCSLTLFVIILMPLVMSVLSLFMIRRAINVRAVTASERVQNKGYLRNGSLCFQYIATFILLVTCSFSFAQVRYMLHEDVGYRTSDIVQFDLAPFACDLFFARGMKDDAEQRQAMLPQAIKKIEESPLFISWDYWEMFPTPLLSLGKDSVSGVFYQLDEDSPARIGGYAILSHKTFEMFNLRMLEGKLLKENEYHDKSTLPLYITESTKKLLKIKDITKETVIVDGGKVQIAGVVSDINTYHLSLDSRPVFLVISEATLPIDNTRMIARYVHGKRKEALAFLQDLYEEINGKGGQMEYLLIEDELENLYADDKRVAHLYATFAMLSILVSCMGLFGISLYDIQHRRREIAIRKVNGAKMKDIFILMSRRYVYTLAVAIAIGTPIALYALHIYIEGYAHHVPLTPLYFFLSAFLMLTLTLLTIFIQVRRAVKENPADVMKSE